MSLTKMEVARAQLVTALDLFLRDKDPIAVHCLACGGGEIIEKVAEAQGNKVFATHIMSTQPQMDRGKIKRLRNQYWNAFKHYSDFNGLPRDDAELFARFDDTVNDSSLFIGWWDYQSAAQGRLPVAAQVFQVWYYAVYEEKLAPDADFARIRQLFPDIRGKDRGEQKRRLRRSVEKYRKDQRLLADPQTEV
jgi:hypothetical protein